MKFSDASVGDRGRIGVTREAGTPCRCPTPPTSSSSNGRNPSAASSSSFSSAAAVLLLLSCSSSFERRTIFAMKPSLVTTRLPVRNRFTERFRVRPEVLEGACAPPGTCRHATCLMSPRMTCIDTCDPPAIKRAIALECVSGSVLDGCGGVDAATCVDCGAGLTMHEGARAAAFGVADCDRASSS